VLSIAEKRLVYLYERLKVLRPSSEELGNRLQTPTLIGCMFLRIPQDVQRCASRFLPAFAAISEALYSDRFFEGLSTLRFFAATALLGFPVGRRRWALSAKP
jgi:hypothetical protein